MSDFAFYCAHCRSRLKVDEGGSGMDLPCPVCERTIKIPPAPVWLPAINSTLRKIVQDNLSGKVGNARVLLKEAIRAAGYDPSKAGVDPGGPEDLLKTERLDLVLNTNHAIAVNHEQFVQDNQPDTIEEWPAWELSRFGGRLPDREIAIHQGDAGIGWENRWQQAASKVGDEAALETLKKTGRMVARIDSGIWDALGHNWPDSLGNPFPPFVLESGYDTSGISRENAMEFGLLGATTAIRPRTGIPPPALILIEDKRITEYLWDQPTRCEHCDESQPARVLHRCKNCEETVCPACGTKKCSRPKPYR